MASLILEERDQKFVLYEMLAADKLCEAPRYSDFSRETFDMVLEEAQKLATEEVLPTLVTGDREGCRLEDGVVHVPKCFHRPFNLMCEGGWHAMSLPVEIGGQGQPVTIRTAAHEWFTHNFAFIIYPQLIEGAAHLIEVYGTQEQKDRYLPPMVAGKWGGTMALTEPSAGSDVGNLSTRAIRQPDGKQYVMAPPPRLTVAYCLIGLQYAYSIATSVFTTPLTFAAFPSSYWQSIGSSPSTADPTQVLAEMSQMFSRMALIYPIIIVLTVPFMVFVHAAWTAFFRRLTGLDVPAPLPTYAYGYPPAPSYPAPPVYAPPHGYGYPPPPQAPVPNEYAPPIAGYGLEPQTLRPRSEPPEPPAPTTPPDPRDPA